MKLEVFREIVEKLKKLSQNERAVYQAGIDLFTFNEELHSLISILIGCYYGKEGLDTFEWWCYEKDWGSRADLTMTDRDGNHLCQTLDDLHEYLEKNKRDDYELPKKMSLSDLEKELNNIAKAFNK